MRVTVPYSYEVIGVPKGAIKERTVQVWEPIEVEIAELDDIEAPVATRWTDWNGFQHETRWHGGRHHRLLDHGWAHMPAIITAEEFAQAIRNGENQNSRVLRGNRRPSGEQFDPAKFRRFDESFRMRVIGHLHDLAASTFILDGKAWRTCSEPAYNLVTQPPRVEPFVLDDEWFKRTSRAHVSVYRADRFEDAMAEAGEGADFPSEITVLIEESISFDDEKMALLDAAGRALDRMSSKTLAAVDDVRIASYSMLRRSHRAASEAWSMEAAEKLLEAFAAFAGTEGGEWEMSRYEAAEARWRLRPIADLEGGFRP